MARSHRPKATIADVAEAAGVSRGTVSRYLNGGRWVSEESAKAVQKAVEKTGYVASSTARALRTGRSRTVAFLIDEEPAAFFGDPTFETLVASVSDALAAQDMSMVVLLAGNAEQARRAVEFLSSGAVAGVVTASVHSTHGTLEEILDQGIPVVNCGYPRTMADRVSYVMGDEAMGGRLMAEHLRARGATRMGVIAGPADSPGGTLRLEAFRQVAGELLPERNIRFGDYTREAGRRYATELFEQDRRIDALFAASDVMAAAVVKTAQERGIDVPGQLLVGGFDDSTAATATQPPLTTIRQPFDRIAAELVSVLLREITDGYRAAVTVPVELVERGSTGATD